MLRFGVFASIRGWLVARADRHEHYRTRADAMQAAVQAAHVSRWRGVAAEVVAQDEAGGTLSVIDPPARPPRTSR
jgi:hypothetical protein